LVDGRLFNALRVSNGAFIVHLRKCQASPQQKFPNTCAEDALLNFADTLLEEFKLSFHSSVKEAHPRAFLVKHRGVLSAKVVFKERSNIYSLALLSLSMIEELVSLHYKQNNFSPVFSAHGSSLLTLNQNYSFLPLSLLENDQLFQNNFWTEISPLLKLKLYVHFGKIPFFKGFMIESPPTLQKAEPPCKIDTLYYRGSFLGEGTFGKVFEIKKNPWDASLALKIMNKGPKENFGTFYKSILSEITGLALCSPFYDIKIPDTQTFQLFMPFYGKQNLFGYISGQKSSRKVPLGVSVPVQQTMSYSPLLLPEQQLGIYRGVLSVFHKLHQRGMAHLDVKMCNIIGPMEDFSSRLIDFGLCSLQEGPQKEILKTTLDTRDPVIFQGLECFTWSDIWSLGVIFSDLVSEKRFSVIPFREPGFWQNGKKYDWDKDETKLCLKCIEESVNDDDFLDSFLSVLMASTSTEIKNANLSVGTAYILSSCLWRNPGKRNSFGLQDTFLGPGLAKWPYPVFTTEKLKTIPPVSNFSFCVKEKHRGHFLLDGSGPFQSLPDIPVLPHLRACIQTKKRKFQLQFIAAVLLDLKEFDLKTFLLAVDILDRVSNSAVQEHTLKFCEHSCLAFVALETACIFFALLQTCPSEPSLDSVLQRALENLPLEFTSLPFIVKDSVPKLWEIILNLLSTVRFQQSWKDSLWNEIVTMGKFHSSVFIKGVLEGLLTWPDSLQTTAEFLSGIKTTLQSSIFGALLPLKKICVEDSWITPEFQVLITSSPFLDVFLLKPKTIEAPSSFPPLPPSPLLQPLQELTFDSYLETFLETKTHPFWIPFPNLIVPHITRSEFLLAVDTYVKQISSHIPVEVLQGKNCIVCNKTSAQLCCACEQWSLCADCSKTWEGRCTQCLFPSEHDEWKKKSVFF
jgi:serine/threonine protein kinase